MDWRTVAEIAVAVILAGLVLRVIPAPRPRTRAQDETGIYNS